MPMTCQYPHEPWCEREAPYQCDICNRPFCSDHGTPRGDREGDESRLTEAYPSQCFACGGFNADE